MKKVWLGLVAIIIFSAGVLLPTGKVSVFSLSVKFKELSVPEFSLKIQLPETTQVSEEFLRGGEVLYNAFLHDDKVKYWGYIQLWKIEDLEKFLQDSKSHSTFNFTSYDRQDIQVKSHNGYLVNWSATFSNKSTVSAKEYFLRKSPQSAEALRISIFTNKGFNDKLQEAVNSIISSVQWK